MAKKEAAEGGEEEAKGGGMGGKLKLVAMILPTVLLILGAVYMFVLAPSGDSSSTAKTTTASAKAKASAAAAAASGEEPSTDGEEDPAPVSTEVPGKLVVVEPVTINLANGHYLKVGLAMQATAAAGEEVTPSKAADSLITEFSGKTVDEIATKEGREAAKKALLKMIRKSYEKQVYELYYTTYVMN
jgi:flagellar protein FliL